jgi:hypothetical protein
MNTLILFIDEYMGSNELVKHGIQFRDSLIVKMLIDGDDVFECPGFEDAMVFYPELLASIEGSGKYLIFTCSCGIAEDGGWEGVVVRHVGQIVSWSFDVGGRRVDYSFDAENYRNEIFSIQLPISRTHLTLEPSRVIFPIDFNRDVNGLCG